MAGKRGAGRGSRASTICTQIIKLGHKLQMALSDNKGTTGRAATAGTRANTRTARTTTTRGRGRTGARRGGRGKAKAAMTA